jgi:hypothetical protein
MIIATYLLEVFKKESVEVCRITDDRVLTCQSNLEMLHSLSGTQRMSQCIALIGWEHP